MAKLDKSQFSKEEWRKIKEQRRLEKSSSFPQLIPTPQESISTSNIAFVLGNGTSRKTIEPEILKSHGKVYGCNALYRTFSPDYLVAVDVKMILEINKAGYQHRNSVWTNPNKSYQKMSNLNFFQPSKGWSSGPTALWLACLKNFKKIYILGFDYQGLGGKFNNVYADTYNYKKSNDSATFHGNWLNQTERVIKEYKSVKFFRIIEPGAFIPVQLESKNLPHLQHMYYEEFNRINQIDIYKDEINQKTTI